MQDFGEGRLQRGVRQNNELNRKVKMTGRAHTILSQLGCLLIAEEEYFLILMVTNLIAQNNPLSFPSVEAHFASVENHILSDIHNYHMAGQQMRQTDRAEEPEDVAEDNWEEEHMDQYIISRFTPERASWRSEVASLQNSSTLNNTFVPL